MLEIIIAIFILVVAVIGAYSAFSRIIVATSIISSRLTAAYLAQEGIEIIRNIRDTNWLKGTNWDDIIEIFNDKSCSSGCEADYTTGAVNETTMLRSCMSPMGASLNIDADGFYSYSNGSPTKFKRKIIITSTVIDVLQVSVLINWEDRGETYNFTAEENLYNWH